MALDNLYWLERCWATGSLLLGRWRLYINDEGQGLQAGVKGEERRYVERKKGGQRVISFSMEGVLYTSPNYVAAYVTARLPKVLMITL